MSFEDWWKKEVLPQNDSPIYKACLLVAWNAAQGEHQKEISEWDECVNQRYERDTAHMNEIALLRAVYMDTRVVMFVHNNLLDKVISESLQCAIGRVERFDEGVKDE